MKKKADAQKQAAPRFSIFGGFDVPLIVLVAGLLGFGVLMVYSASSYNAEVNYGNAYFYLYKQLFGAALGLTALFALAFIDYHRLEKLRYIVLGLSFVLLILVFVPGVGVEMYGARRWIGFPFFTLQASEIAKFGFIIFTAAYMARRHKRMTRFTGILPILSVGFAMCALIILEPNMSITVCVVILMFAMLFIGGARIGHFALLAVPLLAAVVLLIVIEPYRLNRLTAFLNPWESPLDEGYQLIQSFYSLSSGGLFGLGLFNSRQKYLFLPFSESDFIFSVIGEELGFFGCSLVIFAFVCIVVRAVNIARRSADRFGCYLAGGIAALIGVQVLVNIAVVTGSIPPTGLPLPFVSAGTSSLLVFCAGVGVLLSINRFSHKSIKCLVHQNRNPKRKRDRRIGHKVEDVVGQAVPKGGHAKDVALPDKQIDALPPKQNTRQNVRGKASDKIEPDARQKGQMRP
jgi:cell division protein FtsW